MENQLTFDKLLYCYKNLKKHRDTMGLIVFGKHLGYLEAGLVSTYDESYETREHDKSE